MINRSLIRIKVLQTLYMYYLNDSVDRRAAEQSLLNSLQLSYDLYHYFLLLIVDLTRLHKQQLDSRQHKYLPSEDELHPNMRLVNNRLTAQLEANIALNRYISARSLSWNDSATFIKEILDNILTSPFYAAYLADPNDSYETDRIFWCHVFKPLIWKSETMANCLEEKSIFWNDDIEIVAAFAFKTLKLFPDDPTGQQPLFPMFKNENDYAFAIQLFRDAALHRIEYRNRLSRHLVRWEAERVAAIDLIILQIALTEILSCPTIPLTVSLNEYIEIAKAYSTPKSSVFVNGVLDAVIKELKHQKALTKS